MAQWPKWNRLEELYSSGIPVVGTITNYHEHFGFTVDVNGLAVHLNKYDLTMATVEDYSEWVGRQILAKVTQLNMATHSATISRTRLASGFVKGRLVQGYVTEVAYGHITVDVGFEARVSIKNRSSERFKEGQVLDVVLLKDCQGRGKYTIASTMPSAVWQAKVRNMKTDDILWVVIDEVKEDGIVVSTGHFIQWFINKNYFTEDFRQQFDNDKVVVTEKIKVAVTKIDDQKQRLYLSMKDVERVQQKPRIMALLDDFVKKYEPGTVFGTEVVQVLPNKIYIKVDDDIRGIIHKKDINWNEIANLQDLVFVGETINAVFLERKDDNLLFSLKHLSEKPYDDELYKLSLKKLLAHAGHQSDIFIGLARRYPYGMFIECLYSDHEGQKGKLLIDPVYGYNLRAIVTDKFCNTVVENSFYRVKLGMVPEDIRRERNQLFQFYVTACTPVDNPYRTDVDLTFEKFTSPASNVATAHLLAEVGKNMYSSKDRMFFELIQNADDAAAEKGVLVNVSTVDDYLVIRHNGYSFDKDDFEAITSAANGTKKANENKTGYKGIGFKSVFTDSEKVFISTGGYRFKFDRSDSRFTDFKEFYFLVNGLTTDEQQKFFLHKFKSEYNGFKGVADIPWQLEPIWVDQFPEVLGNDFTLSNVSIALKLGANKIGGTNGYARAIDDIISSPHFMLFLRNTKRIDFNGKSVSKAVKDGIITLKNSFNDNRVEYFRREDFDIAVNDDAFEKNGIDIRIKVDKKDEETGKIIEAKFIDLKNHELESIPKKIAINSSTTLSFAVPISTKGLVKPVGADIGISMFAFLPTLVKDFRFPFYVNANFILDPPRQRILGDNPWNFYLMQQIAHHLVRWCASLCKRQDPNALNLLITEYFDESMTDTAQLAGHFNDAYRQALETEPFILNQNGGLSKQDEIIIDRSGFSRLVGAKLFCEWIAPDKCLPSDKIDSSILKSEVFTSVDSKTAHDVIVALTGNRSFNDWLMTTTHENNLQVCKWVTTHYTDRNKEAIHTFITQLPLFKVDNCYMSVTEVHNAGYIIADSNINPIKDELSRLGFVCTDNDLHIDHPFFPWIRKNDSSAVFERIASADFSVLNHGSRKRLFDALKGFMGVGEAKLKALPLFKNRTGTFRALGAMAAATDDYPAWLYPYLIDNNECYDGLLNYLIPEEKIFSEIIQKRISEFESVGFTALYQKFNQLWTANFTAALINKYGATSDLLNVIEQGGGASPLFIQKYGRICLDTNLNRESMQYRVIRLALSTGYPTGTLKTQMYVDDKPFNQFTVSDDVVLTVGARTFNFPLSKLLPSQYDYSTFSHVKAILSDIPENGKLFALSPLSWNNVFNRLIGVNNLCTTQSVFILLANQVAGAFRLTPIYIKMTNRTFVDGVLTYCFDRSIDVLRPSLRFLQSQQITDKFINAEDVTLENERLAPEIASWANNDDRLKYLLSLGVCSRESFEVKLRLAFINNEAYQLPSTLSNELKTVLNAFLNWCVKLPGPFVKDKQVTLLKQIFSLLRVSSLNYMDDYRAYPEWDDAKYIRFVRDKIRIHCVDGKMPKRMYFANCHLYTEYDGDFRYVTLGNEKHLYVNTKDCNMENILLGLCDNTNIPFTRNDWVSLFMVSASTLKEKESQIAQNMAVIQNLTEENRRKDDIISEKDSLLKKYLAKYGEWIDDAGTNSTADSGWDRQSVTTMNELHMYAQDAFVESEGAVIDRDKLSQSQQAAAHREAEFVIRTKLQSEGYNCTNWRQNDSLADDDNRQWQSFNRVSNIVNPQGELINMVIKSAKGGYIYLSATDFEFLTSDSKNVLMVWDGDSVHSVTADEIFNKDSNVNLIFDTAYTPKHYYAALSKVFQYVKRTTFAVKNPRYNAFDTVRSFGMDSRTEGIQSLFDDNEI